VVKSNKALVVWGLGLLLFFRLETFLTPFGHDESIFAYMGQEISRGAVLYRDVTDNKPPLIFYVAAAVAKMPGLQQMYLLGLDFLVALVCVVLFYLLIRKWTAAVFWPTTAFIVFTNAHKISQGGFLTEHYLLLFVLLAWLCWLRERSSVRTDILSGIFFALAFFAKPVAAATVGSIGIYALFNLRRQPKTFYRVLWLGVGWLLTIILALLALAWQNVLLNFWQDALLNLSQYQAALSFKDFFANLILAIVDNLGTVGLIWFLFGLALWRGQNHAFRSLFVLCFVLEFVVFAMSKRFFGHYFLQLAPALGFIVALSLNDKHYEFYKRWLIILLGIALFWQAYYTLRASWRITELLDDYRVAAYIRQGTTRADYICSGGENIRIAWLAGRRHFYKRPYVSGNYFTGEMPLIVERFNETKPIYILDDIPAYANSASYQVDCQIGRYKIWRRIK
jgi:4-amino-4-deoxy-L-arabinose transferase-like glycosyltransferase